MQKSVIGILIAAFMMMIMTPVCTAMGTNGGIPVKAASALDTGKCETAQEMVDKITMGWNLGLSLSPYLSPKVDRFISRIVCLDSEGNIYRSGEDVYFHPKTGTAGIKREVGSDPAIARHAAFRRGSQQCSRRSGPLRPPCSIQSAVCLFHKNKQSNNVSLCEELFLI